MVRFKVMFHLPTFMFGLKLIRLSFQNRWLLVELIPCPSPTASALDASSPEDNGINSKQIWSALKQSVINNFGDTAWGAVSSSLTSTLRSFCELRLG